MPSKEGRKVHCPCPRLHNGLVNPRTRQRHFERYGIADTPEPTATSHDSNPSTGTHPEEDIEDAWGMPGSPSDAMEVDNPTQSDQEDSFQRHEDEDEDDDDRPPVLIEEDEEREGEREDEGEDEDEEELEEEDGFVDETAPDDDYSELRRLASMKGHPLSFRTSLTYRLES
jgi:hypothetical protein